MNAIVESLGMTRDFALQGQYDAAVFYYDGVINQISQFINLVMQLI